jgi:hypothetical protein
MKEIYDREKDYFKEASFTLAYDPACTWSKEELRVLPEMEADGRIARLKAGGLLEQLDANNRLLPLMEAVNNQLLMVNG